MMNTKEKKQSKKFPLWIIPIILVISASTIWVRLLIIQYTYSVHQANRTIENLKKEQDKILLDVSRLRSPHRLDRLAKTKFKLYEPSIRQVVHLK